MYDQRVTEYISKNYRRGKNLQQITAELLNAGHSHDNINESFQELFGQHYQSHHSLKSHKHYLFFIISVIAIIILSLLLLSSVKEESPIKLKIQKISAEDITVLRNLDTSLIAFKNEVRYIVLDRENNVVYEYTEQVSDFSMEAKQISIPLESLSSGEYKIIAEIFINKNKYASEEGFKIIEKEKKASKKQVLVCPKSCDDQNNCTKDYCNAKTGFKCLHKGITPCCGNFVCERSENCPLDCPVSDIESVTRLNKNYLTIRKAAQQSNSGLLICETLLDSYFYDECIYNLKNKNSSICSLISDQMKRDNCLLDADACEFIENPDIKYACESLSVFI